MTESMTSSPSHFLLRKETHAIILWSFKGDLPISWLLQNRYATDKFILEWNL